MRSFYSSKQIYSSVYLLVNLKFCQTNSLSLIISRLFGSYFNINKPQIGSKRSDLQYLSDRSKEIQKKFKYLYLWDCSLPDGNSYNHKFGEDCGIFYPSDRFEITEAKAIAKAQNIIDLELEKIGMDLVDSSLSTHVYNRETGQVTLRWCLLEHNYEL